MNGKTIYIVTDVFIIIFVSIILYGIFAPEYEKKSSKETRDLANLAYSLGKCTGFKMSDFMRNKLSYEEPSDVEKIITDWIMEPLFDSNGTMKFDSNLFKGTY